jgi:hypothetical protein
MANATSPLDALAERFAHPSVRVLARELTQLAREMERGTLAWPSLSQLPAQKRTTLPGLESIEAALGQQRWYKRLAVDQSDWQRFGRSIQAMLNAPDGAGQNSAPQTPHQASLIALRLVWGAERFAELPTVILKPPPAAFLEHLAHLPAPKRSTPPEELDRAVSLWLQERQPPASQTTSPLPTDDVRSFARVVAVCRVVGQLRGDLTLEDVAAGYLAWARLLRANPEQLSDISSGWWSSTGRQPGRRPNH